MDANDTMLIQQASDFFSQGDKEKARLLLATVINNDPNNAKAWYGMALCLDDKVKKEFCLKKALALKPGNRVVIQELQKISTKSKPSNNIILAGLLVFAFLCVAALSSIAGLSYLGLFKDSDATTGQGVSLTATLDPVMLSYIVETQYANALQAIPQMDPNPGVTQSNPDIPSPSQTMLPNTATPTITIVPTLSIIENETTICVPQNERVSAMVTKIIDGDTIEVAIGENTYTVRYIGIDSPERSVAQEYYGIEATQKNKDLVYGKKVVLIKDVSETDQYGRLLRYVFVDNIFVNYELVAQGYASTMTYEPDVACSGLFLYTEQLARNALLGLWAPVVISVPTVSKSYNLNCDPAYPDFCIPSPPPDLDCKDINFNNFTVLPPDPHDLDGNDNDGLGCEKK